MRRMVARRSDLDCAIQRRRARLGSRSDRACGDTAASAVIGFCIARAKNASGVSHTSFERPLDVRALFVSGIASFHTQRGSPPDAP